MTASADGISRYEPHALASGLLTQESALSIYTYHARNGNVDLREYAIERAGRTHGRRSSTAGCLR